MHISPIKEDVADLTKVTIENAGYFTYIAQSETFFKEVRKFLQDLKIVFKHRRIF